jgi:hypothetical protein
MPVFRELHFQSQCERCKRVFKADHGGVCTVCGQVLCNAHLHGSFLRRLAVDSGLGGPPTCLNCRAAGKTR